MRFTLHHCTVLILFCLTDVALGDHATDSDSTTIFQVCFVAVIVLIIIFHCWMKRRPLHDVDWDEVCVDDLQRLAEQLESFDSSEDETSFGKCSILEEHEHWMKYLS